MNKSEQILVEALEKIAQRRGFALDELRLSVGGESLLATNKAIAQMALDEYAKQKREWPDKETVIKAAELEFQNISSGQMEDMAVHAFREGVEWVRSYISRQGKSEADRKVVRVLEYCKPHINQMWAATIVGILLDCDFREAHAALNTQNELVESK